MTIEFELKNLNPGGVTLALTGFSLDLQQELDVLVREALTEVKQKTQAYPPPKPTSRRTGRLRASTFVQKKGNAWWEAGTNTPYDVFVLGTATGRGQAWMHVGHWTPFATHAKNATIKLKKRIIDRMKIIKRNNKLK